MLSAASELLPLQSEHYAAMRCSSAKHGEKSD